MTATLNFPAITTLGLDVAPNLTWESLPTVNPPLLAVGLQLGAIAGDHIIIEISSNDGATWGPYLDVTIANAEASDQSATAATLAVGAYLLRARMTRGATLSPWGTAQNINIETAVSAWTPLNASTPAVFWVDASNAGSITKTGTAPTETVTQWRDLSAGIHHLAPLSTAPIYTASALNGKAGITFTLGEAMRTAAFAVAQPFLLVIVWKTSALAPDETGFLLDGDRDAAAGRIIVFAKYASAGGNYISYAGTILGQGISVATNTGYHSRIMFNGAASGSFPATSSKLNASTVTGAIGTAGIVNGLKLNSESGGSNSHICEVYVIPNPTAADITNSDTYVFAKWGLS
jgi:hypothetical protein